MADPLRGAVLADLDSPGLKPVGLVAEQEDGSCHVTFSADYRDRWMMRTVYDEPFDDVLGMLSRSFLVAAVTDG